MTKRVAVKFLPKDPLVARKDGLWPVEIKIDCETIGDGPTSARVAVIDYNADLDTLFAPAKLLESKDGFRGIKGVDDADLLKSFTFHQINVWAIIEAILDRLESDQAFGRPIPWASGLGRLLVLPHAGYQENAFYDRGTGALHLLYFQGPDGKPVYTCLSHDIVAHELGHAILDGLKPGYNEVCSAETAGFHEFFGDALAIMASLRTEKIALAVTAGAPDKLPDRTVVSMIASEFGAAVRGLPNEAYLRGAWNKRTMDDLRGTFEEHDWSEVLTGVYYNLLQYRYRQKLEELRAEKPEATAPGPARGLAMRALISAATTIANVMLRALDYCPPVDLRYDEYARALLRADEVTYPIDSTGIRAELTRIFAARGLKPPPEDAKRRAAIVYALRNMRPIDEITATPTDAYRFINEHREEFDIPLDANLSVPSVYRTNKRAAGGYWAPKERIIEFTWSEDVELKGAEYRSLDGTVVPLFCGGTLVFDSNGNFLHESLVLPTDARRVELTAYVRYLVEQGYLGVADGVRGIGAPDAGGARVRATIEGNRAQLTRNAAMRHSPAGRADSHGHGAHS